MKNLYIIFGANGFMGKRISTQFQKQGDILELDIHNSDITSFKNLKETADAINTKYSEYNKFIINAAGIMDAKLSFKEPSMFYMVNGSSLINIIDFGKLLVNMKSLLHLSSETVYGSGLNLCETDPAIPTHPYGISKIISEEIIRMNKTNFSCISVRLPIIVGSDQAIDNPMTIFLKEAQKDKTITVFNSGEHIRKFLHVDDVIDVLWSILKLDIKGNIFMNSPGDSCSMMDLAKLTRSLIGKEVKIVDVSSDRQAFTLTSNSDLFESYVPNFKYKNITEILKKVKKDLAFSD